MSDNTEGKAGRRDVLRGAATGTLLVAAALATIAPRKAFAKAETKAERKKSRYQESAHVKRYYQTNRY
ncbi:MAG: hypothetical protein KIT16_01505 [Rhodospirillaceae bacterium]|nr:hypothetical protein [Rhodospirillaceae bacterium]